MPPSSTPKEQRVSDIVDRLGSIDDQATRLKELKSTLTSLTAKELDQLEHEIGTSDALKEHAEELQKSVREHAEDEREALSEEVDETTAEKALDEVEEVLDAVTPKEVKSAIAGNPVLRALRAIILAIFGASVLGGIGADISKAKDWFGRFKKVREYKDKADKVVERGKKAVKTGIEEFLNDGEEPEEEKKSVKDKVKDKVDEVVTPEGQEVLEDGIDSARYFLLAKIVVEFTDIDGWDQSNRTKENQVGGVLSRSANAKVPMKDVIDGTHQLVPPNLQDPSRLKAGELVKKYCTEHIDKVTKYVARRDSINEGAAKEIVLKMEFSQFLKEATASYASVFHVIQEVANAGGDIGSAIGSLDFETLAKGDNSFDQSLNTYAKSLSPEELGVQNKNQIKVSYTGLLKALARIGAAGTVGDKLGEPLPENASQDERLLKAILKEISEGNLNEHLLPFFHGVFPDAEYSEIEDPAEHIRKYLLDEMSPAQALRLFFYKEMVHNNNPAGLFMMQAEVVKFISDNDRWSRDRKYEVVLKIADKAATTGPKEIAEEWEKLGAEIDEETLKEAQEIMEQTFQTGATMFGKSIVRTGNEAVGAYRGAFNAFPKTTAAATAATLGYAVARGKMWMTISAATRAAKGKDWLSAQDLATPTSKRAVIRWFTQLFPVEKYRTAKRVLADAKAAKEAAKGADVVADAAKGIDAVEDGAEIVAKSPWFKDVVAKSGTTIEKAREVLSKLKIPPSVANAIAKSKGATQMLVGACTRSGEAGGKYVLTLAARAMPLLKGASRIGGGALVGIDVIMCAFEMHMNEVRIAETDNQDLKDLYAQRDNLSRLEMGVGLGYSLALFAPAATSIAASTIFPAIPAIIAGKYIHAEAEEVTASWLKNDADWRKDTPGELMRRKQTITVGQMGKDEGWFESQNWATGTTGEQFGRWAFTSKESFEAWKQKGFESGEGGNAKERFEMTKAYMALMTDIAKLPGETKESYSARFEEFQRHQIAFMERASGGTFSMDQPRTYENTHAYAEVRALAQSLKDAGESRTIEVEKTNKDRTKSIVEFDLASFLDFKNPYEGKDGVNAMMVVEAYKREKQVVSLIGLQVSKEMNPGDKDSPKRMVENMILDGLKYDLANATGKILGTDFSGWEWSGGEGKAKKLCILLRFRDLRKTMQTAAEQISKKPTATVEDINAVISQCRGILEAPINADIRSSVTAADLTMAENYVGSVDQHLDYRYLQETINH